jgi:hypothetical protein
VQNPHDTAVDLSRRPHPGKTASIALACVLAGCGAQGPAAPTSGPAPPAVPGEVLAEGTDVSLFSAETNARAVNVTVAIDGMRYETDGTGSLRLSRPVALPAMLEASSPEFLVRETVLRSRADLRLYLWPRQSATGLDEARTRALVYTDANTGGPVRLRRANGTRVVVVPEASIRLDPEALAAHRAAAEALSAATRGAVTFEVRETAEAGTVVHTMVNPNDPAMSGHAALAYRTVTGNTITGARVVFLSVDVARMTSAVMHELAHTFGLEHSIDAGDLMYPIVSGPKGLSPREHLVIELMLMRQPGNQFPDNDRDGLGARGRRVEVVACGRHGA